MVGINGREMIELLRTNDLVLISRVEALLAEHEIDVFVADQYMSAMEGSLGFLPRRVLIDRDDLFRARLALHAVGLLGELSRG
jgi:hypothetical protein